MGDSINFFQNKLRYEIDPSDLQESLGFAESIIVVDARSPTAYHKEHIPHAINLHHKLMTKEATATWNPEYTYVVYCDGVGCNASTKGALNLSRLGFQARELIGGIECWKKDGFVTIGSDANNASASILKNGTMQCNCK